MTAIPVAAPSPAIPMKCVPPILLPKMLPPTIHQTKERPAKKKLSADSSLRPRRNFTLIHTEIHARMSF